MTQLRDRLSARTPAALPVTGAPLLQGLVNFRSVADGEAANGTRLLFRSGTPDALEPADELALTGLGVRTIIDLREPAEAVAGPSVARGSFFVLSRPIYGAPAPVAQPVAEVYRHIALECADAVVDAVRTVIGRLDAGVLVHCAAGKDRTGIVIAVLLSVAGFDRSAIVADYSLSAESFPQAFRERTLERLRLKLTDPKEFATAAQLHLASPPSAIEEVLDLLQNDYGGATAYLLSYGATRAEIQRARTLLNPAKAKANA